MKRIALVLMPLACTAAMALSATCLAAAQIPALSPVASNSAIAQHLMANERASWNLAIKRDATPYKALHAPDYFTLTPTGEMDRAQSEAFAMDAGVRFDECDLSAFVVHVVAKDAILLTYRVKAAGLDHGKAFRLDSYASSLWMRRQGEWLNVFYQATPAPAR
jgi:hypothetical protein